MTAIPLGVGHYVRQLGRTPPILVVNMYAEKDPSNLVDGLVRLQRPGLVLFTTLGSGPINGVFQQPGTFNGDYLVVSGPTLFRLTQAGVSTVIGSVGLSARVSIAASATRAVIATGAAAYSTDGVTLTPIVMPDGRPVSSVAYMNGYFILTQSNSQRFYWIAPGETDPDALSFASAENSPDNISAVKRLFDELWFFGEGSSTEVFQATGSADLPFRRIQGRLYEVGCSNRDTIASLDNTLFWAGGDNKVYRGANNPERISDHAIEEALRLSEPSGGWAFSIDGHAFYTLRIGSTATFVFDVENATWYHWKTYGRETWRAYIGTNGSGAPILAGDDQTGILYTLDPFRSNDNGTIIVRQIAGGVAVVGKPVRCDSVVVQCSTGWADVDQEPVMEINWTDGASQVFDGAWMPMSLGRQGDYIYETSVRQLGLINPPGRIFHLRMSDDASWRLSTARMNEL